MQKLEEFTHEMERSLKNGVKIIKVKNKKIKI
jgi:hypothetical protein